MTRRAGFASFSLIVMMALHFARLAAASYEAEERQPPPLRDIPGISDEYPHKIVAAYNFFDYVISDKAGCIIEPAADMRIVRAQLPLHIITGEFSRLSRVLVLLRLAG